MMRDEDKPFICYKSGWSMKIVPRNAAGWRALAVWTVPVILLMIVSAVVIERTQSENAAIGIAIAFAALMIVWTIALIRWTKARSEIVDMDELIALKRERDRSDRPNNR